MAAWPTLEALKQTLDVRTTDWDSEHHLAGVLAAAISQVKFDVGDWDDVSDVPDESLARAAHLLAVRIAKAPAESSEAVRWAAAREDTSYGRLLKGHRRRFAIG
jgi:hypothetical protein